MISFKCHLRNKFCISDEEGVHKKNSNWTPRGVNCGVMQFNTQCTHVSRLRIEIILLFWKTVSIIWSQIFEKRALCVQQPALKKNCAIQFLRFVCFYFLIFFFNWFHVIRQPFYSKSETPFSKQFSLNYFFVFFVKVNSV